jgi:hypothetical protein
MIAKIGRGRVDRLQSITGGRLLVPPESFLVSKHSTLLKGEAARARSWGALIGETARAVHAASKRR